MAESAIASTPKKQRSKTMHPDHETTLETLVPIAKKRKQKFEWDASDYSKTRGSTADIGHLALVAHVLWVLVQQARNGFPCQKKLRDILIELDLRENIFELADASTRFRRAFQIANS